MEYTEEDIENAGIELISQLNKIQSDSITSAMNDESVQRIKKQIDDGTRVLTQNDMDMAMKVLLAMLQGKDNLEKTLKTTLSPEKLEMHMLQSLGSALCSEKVFFSKMNADIRKNLIRTFIKDFNADITDDMINNFFEKECNNMWYLDIVYGMKRDEDIAYTLRSADTPVSSSEMYLYYTEFYQMKIGEYKHIDGRPMSLSGVFRIANNLAIIGNILVHYDRNDFANFLSRLSF